MAKTRAAAVLVLVMAASMLALFPASAQEPDGAPVVVNEMSTRGPNGATDNFIELRNVTDAPVDISGWQIQRCNNNGFVGTQVSVGDHVMEPGGYYLVAHETGYSHATVPDATYPVSIADNGGGRVLDADGAVVDGVGFAADNNLCTEGDPAPQLTTAQGNEGLAATRDADGTDTDDNATDFTLAPRTPTSSAGAARFEMDCGDDLLLGEGESATTTVTATDPDGTITDVAVTAVDPSPDPGSITVTDVEPAEEAGGTATATVTVDDEVPAGSYTVEVTASNDDDPPQTQACTLAVDVLATIPIGEVQGVVEDDDDGHAHRSPFAPPSGNAAGETVQVQGVIYQRILTRSSAGNDQHGFFLQNTAEAADGDPDSSDGIFVFMGGFEDLVDGYKPEVGDEVVLRGRVGEFFFQTQLSSARLVELVRSGVDLDEEVPAFEADPPDDLDEAGRYWERREGMRGQVPADSVVISGREVFSGSLDSEVWVIRGDHPVAQRENPYERRVFRDPHPLDNNPSPAQPGEPPRAEFFDDGNGYRIVMTGAGIKWEERDNRALLSPARTFATVTNAPVGGVAYGFGKYSIHAGEQPELEDGVDPSENAPFEPFDRDESYSTAIYNVENLYDFRDNPFSGCDFPGNPGCPGVSPPFDYVPESDEEYRAQLHGQAAQIAEDLHAPDIVLIQEAEDQDICGVVDGEFYCQEDVPPAEMVDDFSGGPDTVEELAFVIGEEYGYEYDAVFDRDSSDARGIVTPYLFRTDRVELLPADPDHPVLGSDPQVDWDGEPADYNTDVENPKSLNAAMGPDDGDMIFTRAPMVAAFRVWRDGVGEGDYEDLYLVNNHFAAGPDNVARLAQRINQADYNAAIADALLDHDPDAKLFVGGDFNVFPRPDDPFRPGDPQFPSDQLAGLYDTGMTNLYDVIVEEVPEAAYSYTFQGQAQTLDSAFVTDELFADLEQVRAPHINADWPADDADNTYPRRGESDHDPMTAQWNFAAVALECPGTVVILGVDTGIPDAEVNGACLGDLIAADGDWRNHGQFVSNVNRVLDRAVAVGAIDSRDRGSIVRVAAQSGVGRSAPKGRPPR